MSAVHANQERTKTVDDSVDLSPSIQCVSSNGTCCEVYLEGVDIVKGREVDSYIIGGGQIDYEKLQSISSVTYSRA